jgi:hypothetical protein
MAIGLGPGKGKKKEASKPLKATTQSGQMKASPGYAMGLIKNEKAMKEPTKTKTSGEGAKAVSVTTRAGIIGPKPAGPGGKAPAAAPKKKTAVGKVMKKVGRDIDYAAGQVKNALTRSNAKKYSFNKSGGGSKRGTKSCAAYR